MRRLICCICFLTLSTLGTNHISAQPAAPTQPSGPAIETLIAEFHLVGAHLDRGAGPGLLAAFDIALSRYAPAAWADLQLLANAVPEKYRTGRIARTATLVISEDAWTLAVDMRLERAVRLVDSLDGTPRSFSPSGTTLDIADGQFTLVFQAKKDLRGNPDPKFATLQVTRGGETPITIAAALADRPRAEPVIRVTAALAPNRARDARGRQPLATLIARPSNGGWDIAADGPAEVVDPSRVPLTTAAAVTVSQKTLPARSKRPPLPIDADRFLEAHKGATVAIAGRIAADALIEAPVLGAVLPFFPRDAAELLNHRPAVFSLWSNEEGRITLVAAAAVEAKADTAHRVDDLAESIASSLNVTKASPGSFDGFRPEAARCLAVDGSIAPLLAPVCGEMPSFRWERLLVEGDLEWWALGLTPAPSDGEADARPNPFDQTHIALARATPATHGLASPLNRQTKLLSVGHIAPARLLTSLGDRSRLAPRLTQGLAALGSLSWTVRETEAGGFELSARVRPAGP